MKKIYVLAFILWTAMFNAVGQPCVTLSPAYISGEEINLCGGKTVTYSCTPVDGATGYTWEVPAGFTIVSGQGTATVSIKTASLFTQAVLKVSAVFPCGNSIQTTKSLNALPPPYDIVGPDEILRGSTNNYSLPSVPGMKYSWVADGSNVVGGWNTNSVSIKVGQFVKYGYVRATVSNSCGGTGVGVYFRVLEAANCETLSLNYQVTNPDPCPGSSNGAIALSVTGGNPPYTYSWTSGNGFNSTSQNISGLSKGAHYITVKDSKGCTHDEYIYVGEMYPSTEPPFPISGPSDNLCGVKTVSYTATETPGATGYNWTIPNGFTLVSGQGTKTVTIKTPPKFDLAFLKVSAILPCGNTEPIILELRSTPPNLETQITGPYQVLVGSVNTYSLPAVSGISYSWVADGGNVVSGWGSNSVGVKAGAINGYVRATIKNACGTSPLSTKFFTIRTGESCDAPSVDAYPAKHPERCAGSKTGEIRLSIRGGTGPFTYKWTGPNGFYRTTQNISGIEAGTYKVVVTAPGGCYVTEYASVGPPESDKDKDFPGPIRGQFENLCGVKTVAYSCTLMPDATAYEWIVPEGFTLLSGQGTTAIIVQTPATFNTAVLKVRAMIECGYTDYRNLVISSTIRNPSETLYGPDEVLAGQTNNYTWGPLSQSYDYSGFSYSWVADGGNVVGGWNTNRVDIKAGRISGYVRLTMKNKCGTAPLATKYFKTLNADIPYSNNSVLDNNPIATATAITQFSIYPNPVDNITTVEFSSEEKNEKYQLIVMDAYGRKLQSQNGIAMQGANIIKLNLGNFAKGVYMVNLVTKKKARTMKLIKK